MVFNWSLSDSNSPQVSRTLFSILTDLNSTVVWMVSTRPPISKSSSPRISPLVTVPSAPIIIGIPVTFMFYSFVGSLARSRNLFFFSFISVLLCSQTERQSPQFSRFFLFFLFVLSFCSFFLLTITRSGRLAEIKCSIFISKSQIIFCILFSRPILSCTYSICSYGQFSVSGTIPNRSPFPPSLILYSFCANLPHSLMWLIVSSL